MSRAERIRSRTDAACRRTPGPGAGILVALLLAAACGPDAVDASLASGEQEIVGGAPTSDFPAVWGLAASDANRSIYCTGTLVAPGWVLTAAHCVMDDQGRPTVVPDAFFVCPDHDADGDRPECWVDVAPSDPGNGGLPFVHPKYDDRTIQGMAYDVAVIRAAPTSVAPVALPSGPLQASAVGTDLRIVGYGLTDGLKDTQARYAADTELTFLGPMAAGTTAPNPEGLADETFQNAGQPNTCFGDSGGPLFWPADAPERTIVGTVSWGDETCTDFGVNVDVGEHLCWLAEIGVPGAVCPPGLPERCDNGVDDDQDGAVDCADTDCADDGVCVAGGACKDAPALACGATVHGTTSGGTQWMSTYDCSPGYEWPYGERAYRVDAPAGTRVTATLDSLDQTDLDLFAIAGQGGLCPPDGCLAASVEGQGTPDVVTLEVPAGGLFLVVDTYDAEGPFDLALDCAAVEDCSNGSDDDGDGKVDCEDPDCAAAPACAVEDCTNGVDDDGDGQIDCADSDCAAEAACEASDGGTCTDGGCDGGSTSKDGSAGDPGGCGCAAGGARGAQGLPAAAAFLLLALSRRRRRRSGGSRG